MRLRSVLITSTPLDASVLITSTSPSLTASLSMINSSYDDEIIDIANN